MAKNKIGPKSNKVLQKKLKEIRRKNADLPVNPQDEKLMKAARIILGE